MHGRFMRWEVHAGGEARRHTCMHRRLLIRGLCSLPVPATVGTRKCVTVMDPCSGTQLNSRHGDGRNEAERSCTAW